METVEKSEPEADPAVQVEFGVDLPERLNPRSTHPLKSKSRRSTTTTLVPALMMPKQTGLS